MGATGTGKTASVMNGVGAGIFKPKFCLSLIIHSLSYTSEIYSFSNICQNSMSMLLKKKLFWILFIVSNKSNIVTGASTEGNLNDIFALIQTF